MKKKVSKVHTAQIMWFSCGDCGKIQFISSVEGMQAIDGLIDKRIERAIKKNLSTRKIKP